MRMTYLKAILKTAVQGVTVLLLGAGVAGAQISLATPAVSLTAEPTYTTLPDGSMVPMWGYFCGTATAGSTATCKTLNPAFATTTQTSWSPVVITVPAGTTGAASLTINLTNSLTFTPTGAATANTVPTSIVIVGQVGGGLGSARTTTPSPTHSTQSVTWATANSGPTNVPPPQGPRVQSFATEVAEGTTTALTWPALKPGTYLLESGTHPSIQVPMGLYGILVVTSAPTATTAGVETAPGTAYPAVAATTTTPLINAVTYDAEIPLEFSEIDPVQNNLVNTAVNSVGFNELTVWSGQPGGCGNPATANSGNCYPPAVNYTPLYYLINGVGFNKTSSTASLFPVTPATIAPAAATTGTVLVRMVNAGLRMHVPAIVGSQVPGATGASNPIVTGYQVVAEDGNHLPGLPKIRSEIFMAAGKTFDVTINGQQTTGATIAPYPTALAVFDRELSLSGNATEHDAGMVGYIGINGNTLPADPAFTAAIARADTYNALVAGQTLAVSDPAKGVIANDTNVYGVTLLAAAGSGTVTLNRNGTFTYVPTGTATSDSFTYCANGTVTGTTCSSGITAAVTLAASNIVDGGITCTPSSFGSTMATYLAIKTPGVLANCKDGANLPVTVVPTSIVATGLTVHADVNGGFTAVAPAAGVYTFTFVAQNSHGVLSTPTSVSVNFPAGSGLTVTVLDGQDKKTPITDYRWVIEEDRTFYINPACSTNPPAAGCPTVGLGVVPTLGTNFHSSYMPFVAQGCTGPLSCEAGQTAYNPATGTHTGVVCDVGNGACRSDSALAGMTPVLPSSVQLDPTKRYYISVLPGDAANPFTYGYSGANCQNGTANAGGATCGHGMGGAPIAAGQTAVTMLAQPSPYPPGKLSVMVFEDDTPLNGEQDGGGGVDVLSPVEPGLGGFQVHLWDAMGGNGDFTGQMTYDMFNQPLTNSLAGTKDPNNGNDACPVGKNEITATSGSSPTTLTSDTNATGITGMIVTCPKFESDGKTLSPLAGQAIVANLMPGRWGVVATPGADRIARGEEWLQTNTLDGQKAHDVFTRIGEPSYFQEFGPASYHVTIGFANPAIINARHASICDGADPASPQPGIPYNCNNALTGKVTGERLSRTPDERLYSSGSHDTFYWTQCYVSFGDPDGEDFAFTKCNSDGTFTLTGLPDGDWRVTVFDEWNDLLVDGLSTPVGLAGGTAGGAITVAAESGTTATVTMSSTAGLKVGETITISGVTPPAYNGTFVITGMTATTISYALPGATTGLAAGSGGSANPTTNLGDIASTQWETNLYTRTFIDDNKDGISQASEAGIPFANVAVRLRDGSLENLLVTDFTGTANFNETFPLFSWYVVETDVTRYKNSGTHVVYDVGGPADGSASCGQTGYPPCGTSAIGKNMANTAEIVSVPTNLRIPGSVYCAGADCSGKSIQNGPGTSDPPSICTTSTATPPITSCSTQLSSGRIDAPWVGVEGWQGFPGQNSFMEFGKAPYAPSENGGIKGHVVYASTRPFDDPMMLVQTQWTPLVPHVRINLYQEGFAADGITPTLTLVDTTQTSSFDDYAQGFRSDGMPNMNCPGQGGNSGAIPDLFFFSLYNQPAYLNLYDSQHGGPAITALPNNSQFKCYDGMHNWNQVQPAPYDGMYQFPSVLGMNTTTGNTTGTNCTICLKNPDPLDNFRYGKEDMLPPGKYVVEVVLPPGFELVKEEDKNILIGDNFIAPVTQEFGSMSNIFIIPDQASVSSSQQYAGPAYNANNAQNPTVSLGTSPQEGIVPGFIPEPVWPCVGEMRIVPDYISLYPQSKQVAPFAGATRPLCDRKEVTLGNQMAAIAKFYVYTSTHIASKFTGGITDDYTSEFDPFSPQFGEKFAPPDLPVSIKDWAGNEISRVYADHWGSYDGMTYSTWEVNPPNPTGYSPTMMVFCMNDPGPIPGPGGTLIQDPAFAEGYSQFCYELPFMPGTTQYLDTPVVPTSAFAGAGYNNVDCSYPDTTPAIAEVDGDGVGPYVSAAGHNITITALGDQMVPNNAYSGPSATTAPYNQRTIKRHYGFGSAAGTVTIGGINAPVVGTWGDLSLTVTVPTGVANCAVQQQAQYGGSAAQCGQLVITSSAGKQSIDTVTVTIGGKAPTHVAASASIQNAIDYASPGDLIIIDPTCIATTTSSGATAPVSCSAPLATGTTVSKTNATHNELVLMWKPVRLQGVGAASSVIDATTHPAGKLDAWRQRVVCLFGLTIQGTPVTSSSPFDPTGSVSCGSTGGVKWTGYSPTTVTSGTGTSALTQVLNAQVDPLPLEAIVGWDASQNGNLAQLLQEPTLMGALEGAGITVVGKGVNFPSPLNTVAASTGGTLGSFPTGTTLLIGNNVNVGGSNPGSFTTGDGNSNCHTSNKNTTNPFPSNFACNPSGIDGVMITESSQGGGGIFVHGWAHYLQIANNRIISNAGTLSGGINLGQGEFAPSNIQGSTTNGAPGSCVSNGVANNAELPYCENMNVNIHHNDISLNSSTGDELFSGTPAGAGGISICTGADYYKFNYNWVCGNLSSGDGGGVGHLGVSYNGDIEHNSILFNQSLNPTIPANGGGLLVMGTPDVDTTCGATIDIDCLDPANLRTPSDGIGPNLVINANLIMGNAAESGSGGGLRLQNVNGGDVLAFPTSPTSNESIGGWWSPTITNNIIADNIAGWDGAGISMVDTLNVNIAHNTVVSNTTTASAGILFTTIGAPLASSEGSNSTCNITATTSCPQPSGLVTIQNSTGLVANLPATVKCPSNHYAPGTSSNNGSCRAYSYPYLADNIFWDNNAYYIGVGALSAQYQQNVVALYNAVTGTPAANQTVTGACLTSSYSYWDLGARGDTGPTNHAAVTLNPLNSVITSTTGYAASNSAATQAFISQYCNGSRTPPEFAVSNGATGGSGYNVPAGISDASVPNPIFNLTPVATVDEGNNWINLRWGPLSLTNPTVAAGTSYGGGAPLGNYTPVGAPAVGFVASGTFNNVEGFVGSELKTDFFGNLRPTHGAVDAGAIQTSGAAQAAVLSVTGGPLSFTSVVVGGTSASQTLTLHNTGTAGATGIGVTFAGPFARATGGGGAAGSCGTTLAAGTTCTINVVFTPTASGPAIGTATIAANVAVTGSPVSLSGTGAAATHLALVSTNTLAFGNWATGTTSNTMSLTVTNIGNSALAGGTFTFGGGTPQPFSHPAGGGVCGTNLAVGATCTYTVRFAPTAVATYSRTLTVAYTGGATVTNSPVTLTGAGVAAKAAVTVTPITITDAAGVLSNSGTVTFTNAAAIGGSDVAITGVRVSGAGLIWAFTVGTDGCTGTNLAPGASCTVQVNFGRFLTTGTFTGAIRFTDTGAASPQSAVLTGIAQ
jgi:hypothetical protein